MSPARAHPVSAARRDGASDQEPSQPEGRIRPTSPGPLVIVGVIGLVAGWAVRPLVLRTGLSEPNISLVSVSLLYFAVAIIGGSAYLTRRTVQRDRYALEHHQAVNRLVLGKACALVGALLTGCYLGYAVAQLGVESPASDTRLWRSLLAALGAAAVPAPACCWSWAVASRATATDWSGARPRSRPGDTPLRATVGPVGSGRPRLRPWHPHASLCVVARAACVSPVR